MSNVRLFKSESLKETILNISHRPSNDVICAFERGGFDRVTLSEGNWSDLSFMLKYIDSITHLRIASICDWSVISKLVKLKRLAFTKKLDLSTVLSFKNLTDLEQLKLYYSKGLNNDFCELISLKDLEIIFWPATDCTSLSKLTELKELFLFDCRSLQSLEGIQNLTKLEKIHLERVPKLSDISKIRCLPSLKKLVLYSSKQINNLEVVAGVPSLEELYMDNFNIDSLEPLSKLGKLHELRLGDCKLLDLDIKAAHNIPNLKFFRYKNKKGYNLKYADASKVWNQSTP